MGETTDEGEVTGSYSGHMIRERLSEEVMSEQRPAGLRSQLSERLGGEFQVGTQQRPRPCSGSEASVQGAERQLMLRKLGVGVEQWRRGGQPGSRALRVVKRGLEVTASEMAAIAGFAAGEQCGHIGVGRGGGCCEQ